MPRGKTGAIPTERGKYNALARFVGRRAAPFQIAYVPARLSMWGNNQYGDCVTAEEAFKCAAETPEVFLDDSTVISWARSHGVLNGATLTDVLDMMRRDGFKVGPQAYDDGPYGTVDYTNPSLLKTAIATGPVKIAIDSSALPGGAGDQNGWVGIGGQPNQYRNIDHCVSLCGYGRAGDLFHLLNAQLPSNLPAELEGYLLFTWSTIGFVDLAWLLSCCAEAYVRNPNTVFDPPLDPNPPVPPPPGPSPNWWDTLVLLIPYLIQFLQFLLPLLEQNKRTKSHG